MGVLVEKDVVCHHLLVATSPSVMQHLVLVLNNGGGGDEGAHTCSQGVGTGCS